jgi:hypothetical protein
MRIDILLAVASITLAACRAPDSNDTQSGRIAAGADVAGDWRIQLHLDSSILQERPSQLDVSGELRLRYRTAADTQWGVNDTTITHLGRARLSLKPFGFGDRPWERKELGSTSIGPGAYTNQDVAVVTSESDSIHIRINPFVSHGGLDLYAPVADDSLKGRWMVPGIGPAAWGRFTMVRVK